MAVVKQPRTRRRPRCKRPRAGWTSPRAYSRCRRRRAGPGGAEEAAGARQGAGVLCQPAALRDRLGSLRRGALLGPRTGQAGPRRPADAAAVRQGLRQDQQARRGRAEACCEAVQRPSMRFVAVKTEAQQATSMLHRVRDQLIGQRTATINALRGHLAELGIVAAQRQAGLRQLLESLAELRTSASRRPPAKSCSRWSLTFATLPTSSPGSIAAWSRWPGPIRSPALARCRASAR